MHPVKKALKKAVRQCRGRSLRKAFNSNPIFDGMTIKIETGFFKLFNPNIQFFSTSDVFMIVHFYGFRFNEVFLYSDVRIVTFFSDQATSYHIIRRL